MASSESGGRCRKLFVLDVTAFFAPAASTALAVALAVLLRLGVDAVAAHVGAFLARDAWMTLPIGFALAQVVHRHASAARGLQRWARRQVRRMFLADYVVVGCAWSLALVWAVMRDGWGAALLRQLVAGQNAYWIAFGWLGGCAAGIWAIYVLVNRAATKALRTMTSHVYCEQCGYILDGLTGERCPECSSELAPVPLKAPFGHDVFLR